VGEGLKRNYLGLFRGMGALLASWCWWRSDGHSLLAGWRTPFPAADSQTLRDIS
jgi:hypothetical protein